MTALLWVAVCVLTICETYIATRRTQAIVGKRRIVAANWEAVFEAVLLLDIYLITNDYWLGIPICIGAWIGMYFSLKK